MQLLASGQGITDLEVAGIWQTNNIASESLIHHLLLLCHEGRRATETHHLAETYMLVVGVTLETAGANLHEGDATTVVRIHIGMDLEHEAGEVILIGIHLTLQGLHRTGRGSDVDEAIEQLLHSKVVQCRAKEDRGNISSQIGIHVERRIYTLDHLHILTQLGRLRRVDVVFQLRAIDVFELHVLRHILLARRIEIQLLLIDVIDATETLPHVDRPA